MKNIPNFSFNSPQTAEQRVVLLENKVRLLNDTLKFFFVQGRLRTDRSAPTSSADVQTPDLLYDRVLKDDYEYTLINNAGTLEWRRITNSAF